MPRSVAAALLLFAFASPAAAFDTPRSLLDAIYTPYVSGGRHEAPESFYSERLKQLVAQNLERQAVDASGAPLEANAPDMLAFDPFIEGRNALLLDLAIGEPAVKGDRAVAAVSFHNFDHLALLSIAMVREPEGWRVDDIASFGSGENWLLSWLLQYDPFSVP